MKYMAILGILLAPTLRAQSYTLSPTGTPAAIGGATHAIDAIPTLVPDPASGKVFMFYAEYSAGILGQSWIIMKHSTVTRLDANAQDWDVNADTSKCSGSGIPAGCFVGDGINGFGNGAGGGITPSGALMYAYLETNPNDTLSLGSFYVRSTDHGTTWSTPVAFSVTYPQTQYDSPSGQFVSIPAGQVSGTCAGGCVLKTVRTCNVGCTSNLGNELLFSTDDGVTFTIETHFPTAVNGGLTDEIAMKWAGGSNLLAFVRPNKSFNPPDPLPFLWSTDVGTTWHGTCGIPSDPANCVSPNQPDALSACATPSTNYDEFTWPHVITTPINSAYMTVMFGERFNCNFGGPGLGFFWNMRTLTFNSAGVLASQTFQPVQYFYNQNSIIGFAGTGNSTYSDFAPTTGNNVIVVMEIPSFDFTCGPSGGIACEQIWSMNAQYQLVGPSTVNGGAKVAGEAKVQ